ncbi:MAG: NUDIX hydrolase [Lachnospiraceae bacterium]|nr:NUDIX hydrolase [Lachnospiraceae bacterium]
MAKKYNFSSEEKAFLEAYDPGDYPRPAVTADIVVFTVDSDNDLNILLIKRKDFPYKGYWAVPGGFMKVGEESAEETAVRRLREETGAENVYLRQLATFSRPDRDPRMHVVSVAYMALVPWDMLNIKAGEGAEEAGLFKIGYDLNGLSFKNREHCLLETELAFDHDKMIKTALWRLRNRIDYEPDAFYLLKDKSSFTVYELQKIYESIKNKTLDTSNFRKFFTRSYINTGTVICKNIKSNGAGKRPAALYEYIGRSELL